MKKLTLTILVALLLVGTVFGGFTFTAFNTENNINAQLKAKGLNSFVVKEIDCKNHDIKCYDVDYGRFGRQRYTINKLKIEQVVIYKNYTIQSYNAKDDKIVSEVLTMPTYELVSIQKKDADIQAELNANINRFLDKIVAPKTAVQMQSPITTKRYSL